MASQRERSKQQSRMMAFSGMAAALSAMLLLTGSLIPIMTYAAPLFCGVLLLPVLLEFGKKAAWLTWGAATLIVLLLGTDREAAFFYLFLGYYPIIKWRLDKLKPWPVQMGVKLIFFTATVGGMYAMMYFLLHMDALMAEFADMGMLLTVIFVILMAVCLLLYDRLLFPLCVLYTNRIRPRLGLKK